MAYLKTLIFLFLVLQLVYCQNARQRSPDTSLKKANEGEFPYQAQLRNRNTKEHICGGAILSRDVVITAANCVYSQLKNGTLDQIEVVAGERNVKKESGHEQVVQIRKAVVHENYGKGALVDDIALLDLRSELTFNEFVNSIPIPKNVRPTEKAVLSGWGKKSYNSRTTVNVLHHLNLTIYNETSCNAEWEMALKLENNSRDNDMTRVLCARHTAQVNSTISTKMTPCDGDSGSPLTCIDDTNFLCGIASASDQFCGQRSNISGLFANVLSYFDWITDNFNQFQLRYNCPCNYFRCINQFCVNPSSLNNGIDDCGDGSDEEKGIRELFHKTSHNYKNWDIESTKYKCHYTLSHPERYRLIDTEYLCDGVLDCPANHPNICNDYKKNISICSPTTQKGTPDPFKILNCVYLTDESNCPLCINGSIKCPNENKCIRPQNLCNGVRNCNDGFDEMKCDSCSNSKSNFHCPSTRTCISIERRCDGNRDCAEGEDEENCNDCQRTGFLCSLEKKCIPERYRCDGKPNDCAGNLDELYCTECLNNSFLCKEDQKCISKNHQCNGVFDCVDQSDEKDCKYCRGYSYHCKSEDECILLSRRCDSKQDCRNNEDEIDCDKCSKESLFHCSKSRRCIDGNLRCDGKKDCEGNEDEDQLCPGIPTDESYDDYYTD